MKGSFRGKLSHTSPILDSANREKKITVYFSSVKSEEMLKDDNSAEIDLEVGQVAKSLALQRVFGKSRGNNIVFIYIVLTYYLLMNKVTYDLILDLFLLIRKDLIIFSLNYLYCGSCR